MEPFVGEIRLFSMNFSPKGWAACEGQLLPINQNQTLYSLLGTTYGGDGRVNFALPDLRGRIPVGVGQAPGVPSSQDLGQQNVRLAQGAQTEEPGVLGLTYCIAVAGIYPSRS